ncbi:hypothetical protein C8J57DRAFT_1271654 [Mycena rebaudengoi]|nr:hypothetical protein C8J57DRAFT_1271654 [Mycena rebaudengoi]
MYRLSLSQSGLAFCLLLFWAPFRRCCCCYNTTKRRRNSGLRASGPGCSIKPQILATKPHWAPLLRPPPCSGPRSLPYSSSSRSLRGFRRTSDKTTTAPYQHGFRAAEIKPDSASPVPSRASCG